MGLGGCGQVTSKKQFHLVVAIKLYTFPDPIQSIGSHRPVPSIELVQIFVHQPHLVPQRLIHK